ncbi:hypothetical protein V1477_001285 [Vespula maculifrons]|uniref:Uncharacterized protein n=1 Tax=Vespula maculifrons TaxID=7453 RepID=A0ABD2CZF3_VESMC
MTESVGGAKRTYRAEGTDRMDGVASNVTNGNTMGVNKYSSNRVVVVVAKLAARNSSSTVSDGDGSDGTDGGGGGGGGGDDGGGTVRISEENGNRRVDARTFTNVWVAGLRVGETRVIEGQRFDRSSDSRIVLDWKSEMLVRRTEATGNGVDIKAISQHQLSPFQTVGSEVEWSGQ